MKRHDIRRAMIAASAALPLVLHATKVHAQDVTGRVASENIELARGPADVGHHHSLICRPGAGHPSIAVIQLAG